VADIVPVSYTNYNVGISHARRAGERYAVCGVYVWIRATAPESCAPKMPMCHSCSAVMNAENHPPVGAEEEPKR
jgi:hypothetical protein